jgi:hypothetical protein
VYQALEYVADRKVKAVQNKNTALLANRDGLDDGGDEFEDEERFLSLDDTLEDAENIDLIDTTTDYEINRRRLPATLLALEDVAPGVAGDGNAAHYRISACAMHHSGALLFESGDGAYLDENLQPVIAAANAAGDVGTERGDALGGLRNEHDAGCDEGFDLGNGYLDAFDVEEPLHTAAPSDQEQPQHTAAGVNGAGQRGVQDPDIEDVYDPYKPLDPNAPSKSSAKPFRKGRCSGKSRSRTAHAMISLNERRGVEYVLKTPAPSTGLLFPEFEYGLQALRQEQARKAQTRRKGSNTTGNVVGRAQLASVFTKEEAEAATLGAEYVDSAEEALLGTVSWPELDAFDDMPHGLNEDDFGDADPAAFDDAAVAAAASTGMGWENLALSAPLDQDDELTYEELVRVHIDAKIRAAEAFAIQTDLTKRVSVWRDRIEPVLEEEDARPVFDIHVYGERILDGLAELRLDSSVDATHRHSMVAEASSAELQNPVGFRQILEVSAANEQYDIPRSFSSMLQLVNSGNLRIIKPETDDCPNDFAIQLVSKVMPHKKIPDYLAPSAVEAQQRKAGPNMDTAGEENNGKEARRTPSGPAKSKRRRA